jgi:hypothetical protein
MISEKMTFEELKEKLGISRYLVSCLKKHNIITVKDFLNAIRKNKIDKVDSLGKENTKKYVKFFLILEL